MLHLWSCTWNQLIKSCEITSRPPPPTPASPLTTQKLEWNQKTRGIGTEVKLRVDPHPLRSLCGLSHSLARRRSKLPIPPHLWVLLSSSWIPGAWPDCCHLNFTSLPSHPPLLLLQQPWCLLQHTKHTPCSRLLHRLSPWSRKFSPQGVTWLLLTGYHIPSQV